MPTTIFHVNAFTDQAFSGNPAAVCILDEEKSADWMQSVAAQMNLSETAFVTKIEGNTFKLRWFTPLREVDMCGHATLASAHSLWQSQQVSADQPITFQTLSGVLGAKLKSGFIELDFPLTQAIETPAPTALINALAIKPIYSAKFGEKYLLQVASEEEVHAMTPDFAAMLTLTERGVTVTSHSTSDKYDFISRYFAPWVGINEDPVNGSSHCALALFWEKSLGKQQLKAYQASQRSGELGLELLTDRVHISGKAITIMQGQLLV